MGEVFLDALIDTLWVLPFLLIMNLLIELLEIKTKGFRANKILKGGIAPLVGTAVGVVPQCGFSVVATELYSKRRIALGTLLAVYLATSDEALPIMLSSYEGLQKVLPVFIIKICFSLIVGYCAFGVEKIAEHIRKKRGDETNKQVAENAPCDNHEHVEEKTDEHGHAHDHDEDEEIHVHGCHHHEVGAEEETTGENATRKQRAARVFNTYFKHPLIHTATVIGYIFLVNVVFGIIVYYVGEDRLAAFIGSTGYFQPALAALVGLIPNCAASVVLTELYVVGGLNLGGVVAGLCVSAGIGYAVLIKQNRPIKNTVLVIVLMYVLSVALGTAITALGF